MIYVLVGFVVQMFYRGESDRHYQPVYMVGVVRMDEFQLVFGHILVRDEADVLFAQVFVHLMHAFFIFFLIPGVQFRYLPDDGFGFGGFRRPLLAVPFRYPGLGCDPDAEEFVQIVRIYTQKRQSFQQRNILPACFLQYSSVEVQPADVSFHVRNFLGFGSHMQVR